MYLLINIIKNPFLEDITKIANIFLVIFTSIQIRIFLKEYKNYEIEKILKENDIKRSLGIKGCPFVNAVSESTYKIIKTEFAYNKKFTSQEDLDIELFDYVNWYNNKRLHGTLGYMSPKEFRELSLEKLSK
ncbi:MAG: IS3 family transposase [Sphaerochaetaceae bacterium]|nr:IS3 family transposase [Sphaerochaetaceae bacterium]